MPILSNDLVTLLKELCYQVEADESRDPRIAIKVKDVAGEVLIPIDVACCGRPS